MSRLLFASALVSVVALTIVGVAVRAQTTTAATTVPGPTGSTTAPPIAVTLPCTTATACYPWSGKGSGCVRGGYMSLRFTSNAIPENGKNISGIEDPVTNFTYAFCPKVDELQAFNLTNFTQEAVVHTNAQTGKWEFSTSTENTYISAIGFGNQTLRTIPPDSSDGRALVVDRNPGAVCKTGEIGVVSFLVLNVSMSGGVFRYLAGHEQPPGNAFFPTCDSSDICSVDGDQRCFGDFPGKKMCGTCYDATKAADVALLTMQIWVSYYGTDANGRLMRSGASNPMNFRKYSLGGVYNTLINSVQNLKVDQLPDADGLNPTANYVVETMRKWLPSL